ncbi:MAG: hypothetical protein QOH90_1059 [Actinomycetota bacterium]|jgi:amino acid transporter|nr:hypothetical protein [Actinomycetota bacterium]
MAGDGTGGQSDARPVAGTDRRTIRRYLLGGCVAAAAAYPGRFTLTEVAKSLAYLLAAFIVALGMRWLYQRIRERETVFWSPWIPVLTALVVVVLMIPDRAPPSTDRPAPDHDQLLAAFDLPGYEFFELPADDVQKFEEDLESAPGNPDVREVESRGVTGPNGEPAFVVIGTLDPDDLNNETLSEFSYSLQTAGRPPRLLDIEDTRVYSVDLDVSLKGFAFLDYDGLVFFLIAPSEDFLKDLSKTLIQANDLGVPKSV